MAGYNQMNRGYNEQPGIDWGKMALYGAGAALGYGVLRAGAMKLSPHISAAASKAKKGMGWAGDEMGKAVDSVRAKMAKADAPGTSAAVASHGTSAAAATKYGKGQFPSASHAAGGALGMQQMITPQKATSGLSDMMGTVGGAIRRGAGGLVARGRSAASNVRNKLRAGVLGASMRRAPILPDAARAEQRAVAASTQVADQTWRYRPGEMVGHSRPNGAKSRGQSNGRPYADMRRAPTRRGGKSKYPK